MRYKGFELNGNGYRFPDLEWKSGERGCYFKKTYCKLKMPKNMCKNTLRAHCCKHIVNAKDHEKNLTINKINETVYIGGERQKLDRLATRDAFFEDDARIVEHYEKLSFAVVDNSDYIIISRDSGKYPKNNLRVCGKNSFDGVSTFISYDSASVKKFRIVSAYCDEINLGDYALLKLLASARGNISKIKGVTISGVIENNKIRDPSSVNAKIVFAFENRKIYLGETTSPRDEIVGTIMNYYKTGIDYDNQRLCLEKITSNNLFLYCYDLQENKIPLDYVNSELLLEEKYYYSDDYIYTKGKNIHYEYSQILGNNYNNISKYINVLDDIDNFVNASTGDEYFELDAIVFDLYFRYTKYFVNIIEYLKYCRAYGFNKVLKKKYFDVLVKILETIDKNRNVDSFKKWDEFFEYIFRINERTISYKNNKRRISSFDLPLVSFGAVQIVNDSLNINLQVNTF